jgi:hypothetical protein
VLEDGKSRICYLGGRVIEKRKLREDCRKNKGNIMYMDSKKGKKLLLLKIIYDYFVGLVIDGHGMNRLQVAQKNLPYPGEQETSKERIRNTKIWSTVGMDFL